MLIAPLIGSLLIQAASSPFRPTPKFEGQSIPDPPQQAAPWTPPETKLPPFLIKATAALFEAGVADPRDCAYREVEIGDAGLITTHAFVLPERPGHPARFAVGWDGIVYPAFSIGPEANLAADIRHLSETLKTPPLELAKDTQRPGASIRFNGSKGPGSLFSDATDWATVDRLSPLKLCLLLRLGRADLAETLFAAATPWRPDAPRPDLTDYQISDLSLAHEWAATMNVRLVHAHQRGDDVVALDAARRLDRFRKAVDAKAEALGFPQPEAPPNTPVPSSYLPELSLLPALLADQERRAKEPPRGPVPLRGGDPTARIAALIRDFDQIQVQPMSVPGSAYPAGAPIVDDLIAEGDPALEPLLNSLVSDRRLTRSVSIGRDGRATYVHPAAEVSYQALVKILKTDHVLEGANENVELQTPEGRRKLASAIRTFWEKYGQVPLAERWYRILRDDSAGPRRWLEAANGLTERFSFSTPSNVRSAILSLTRPDKAPPMNGEALRSRRNPSISELMARRTADLDLNHACSMALTFAAWDLPAALPKLQMLMTARREQSLDDRPDHQQDPSAGREIAAFTLLRVRAGDLKAIPEYAAWVQAVAPVALEHSVLDSLIPMWAYPHHPAIAAAGRAMFLNPKSPWLPLVPTRSLTPSDHLIGSPLVCLMEFRAALLDAFADKSPAGTAQRLEQGGTRYQMKSGFSGNLGSGRTRDPDARPGLEVPFRVCDLVAWTLADLEGAPDCQLDWPELRRDAAVTACAAYLRRFGRNFSPKAPPRIYDDPSAKPRLRFPTLDRPATPADVDAARAIFSLEGEGETRVVPLSAGLPVQARWTALKAFPFDVPSGDGSTRREYLQDGWVWQAEEVRRAGRWERFYGFVGHATIARVPASEIEFPLESPSRASLAGGLDTQLRLPNPPQAGDPPARPVVVSLWLRNRLGVDSPAPTEFLRRADDGKPALRRGVGLELAEVLSERRKSGFPLREKGTAPPLPPTRTARFDPGHGSRTLGPTESFEAFSIDLNDWFVLPKLGLYRLRITFAVDSGLGEKTTTDVYFVLGDPDLPPP